MLNWIRKMLSTTAGVPPSAGAVERANKWYEQARALLKDGNSQKAIECLNKALDLRPDFEDAYRDLCLFYFQAGQLAKARTIAEKGLKHFPQSVELNVYLGNLYYEAGDYPRAAERYLQVLALDVNHGMAHYNLGRTRQELGEIDAAIGSYRRAIAATPGLVSAHLNLGTLLEERGDYEAALACYKKVLAIQPNGKGAYNNIGHVHLMQGRLDEALAAFRKELVRNPELTEAHNNLGAALRTQGRIEDAIACFERAIELDPDNIEARQNLAQSYFAQRNLKDALHHCRKALALDPDFVPARALLMHLLQHACEWEDLRSHIDAVRRLINDPATSHIGGTVQPFTLLSLPGISAAEQCRAAERFAQGEFSRLHRRRDELAFKYETSGGRKIHVGYLSADFHQHATAVLMAEVFELHDRDHFHISAYSCGPDDGSAMRRRLEKAFDSFVDIRKMSDEEAAHRINHDRVDLLVDLKGYTEGARSAILAFRPAPIQVNYLGYPGTMGVDFVDYLIADHFVIPSDHEEHYAEKIIRVDGCYQPNDRKRVVPPAPSRAECGLPDQGFVYCCFNQTYKITSEVFDVWCRLLKNTSDSVLWLLASNLLVEENLKREMKRRGVSPERLVMAQPTTYERHLARLQCADLFLDTLPYNAHTTCSDALWMGLPVVTCVGDVFPGRVAGSLLMAMGMPELIAFNLEDYYMIATALADDAGKREDICRKLIAIRNTAALFDSVRFTRNLEHAYAGMRDAYVADTSTIYG